MRRIKEVLDRLFPRRSFARSVGVLAGGTAGAQLIGILILPVLTRLYTPSDFAVLAIYVAIVGTLSTVACMRMEIAIPIPQSEQTAVNVLCLALAFATMLALLVSLLLLLYGTELVSLLNQPKLAPFLWLVPVGLWLAGLFQALQYWATRKKEFSTIARTRMAQAIGGAGTQAGLGWLAIAPFGLLLGQVISQSAGIATLARNMVRSDRELMAAVRPRGMLAALKEHDRFPKYSTLEALANSGGTQLPVLIIAAVVAGPEVGFLMLAMKVMAAPVGLIGGAVAQVYLSGAAEQHRNNNLGKHTAKVLGGLFRGGIGPILFVGIVSPRVFPFVFGEEWSRAGQIVSWLTPWFAMQLLASPVSMALHVTRNQVVATALQLAGLMLRAGAVLLVARFGPELVVESYAVSGFVFYAVYFSVVLHTVKINLRDLASEFKFPIVLLLWVFLALIVRQTIILVSG